MAIKYSFQVLAPILLLLVLHLRRTESKESENAFGFIKHLEGCHKGESVNGLYQLKQYLNQFGYLKYNTSNNDQFDDHLESAIKTYQRRHHLNVSGSLDSATVEQMMRPRCGGLDFVSKHHTNKSIHSVAHFSFFPQSPRWDKSHLTYRFRPEIEALEGNIRSICGQAFQKWAQVTHFTFEEVADNSAADIEIGFHETQPLERNDSSFDGLRGGVLAHASLPPGGRFHYDVGESLSSNPGTNQLDLLSVSVHEIRHLLGLDHSEDQNAVMYDTFGYGLIKRDLSADDVRGIRTLYGIQ